MADLDEVPEVGSYLFTVRESDSGEEEVILVRCDGDEGPVRAWKNFCQHETDQRLDRGVDARRGGHRGRGRSVYLTDNDLTYRHDGGIDDDDDDMPSSSSHLTF